VEPSPASCGLRFRLADAPGDETPGTLTVHRAAGEPPTGWPEVAGREAAARGLTVSASPAGDRYLMCWDDGPSFLLSGSQVTVHGAADLTADELSWYLLGPVAAFWLRWQGRFLLHAGAVAFSGRAVALAAPSGRGKSTLVAALVGRGALGVADDLAHLETGADGWRVHPAAPRHLLWPDAADRFTPAAGVGAADCRWDKLAVPTAGRWAPADRPLPLAHLLLLRPAPPGAAPAVTPLSAGVAAARLLANLHAGWYGDAAVRARDLARTAELAESVGAAELVVPRDLDRLDEVAAVVERHAAGEAVR